jgi:HK97 family phage major capsid protein
MKYVSPMLDVCSFIDTDSGAPLGYPTDSDINTIGEQVNETQSVTSADPPLSQANFTSFKYSSKVVKVSMELLQDSAFDIEGYLAEKFAYRIGRVLNPLFTTGTGSGQPKGILTGITVGVGPGTTPAVIGNDNATTPDPTQQVGYLDLINLEQSVDPVYRRGAAYMMHDNTLAYIKALKDTVGRPLNIWRPDGGPFGSINGYPVYPNPDMPTLAPGNKTVVFGRLDKYFVRRCPFIVRRLTQRYADYGQVGFIGFRRYDGMLIDADTAPVKTLLQHS